MRKITWNTLPIKNTIIQILLKNKGISVDTDLYNNLLKEFKDLSPSEFSKNIMSLEIQGIINVSRITKTKNRIELLKDFKNH
ncbi:MAG: hypothetical protein ACTSRW_07665 [Candidatus Helarchaeota archaeon]